MKSIILKGFDLLNLFPIFNRYTSNTATVFMLHSVSSVEQEGGCDIPISQLREFFTYLRDSGYNVISLGDYVDAIRNRRTLYKTVVFTVDDGYRNFYLNCFPVFREFDFPASIFLTTDFIEKRIFLWWDKLEYSLATTTRKSLELGEDGLRKFELGDTTQRRKAAREISSYCKALPDDRRQALVEDIVRRLGVDISGQPKGKYEPLSWGEITEMRKHKIEFYPHTKTHPILSRIPYDSKLREIGESKVFLEERLNRTLDIFSYPNGKPEDIDADTIRAVRESGFKVAVTSIPGFNNTQAGNNLFMLHRFAIPESPLRFKQYVSGLEFVKDRLRNLQPVKPFKNILK